VESPRPRDLTVTEFRMNRFILVGALIVALSGLAAAQSDPTQLHYNIANRHTYFLTPTGTNWQSGQAYSRTFGGYLASINDGAEQAFIASRFSSATAGFWIGLSDAASEGTYTWDSGEPTGYWNWCLFEPNNYEWEDHVFIPGGTALCWKDASSPALGSPVPNQALVELAHGDRVDFDNYGTCGTWFPYPFGATGGPSGASWNGAGIIAGNIPVVVAFVHAGMPVSGGQHLQVGGTGPVTIPLGGPFPRPAPAGANEVRIPIPAGTKGVSYAWEFLTAEAFGAPYHDGMSIAVVDVNGNLVQDLTYADISWLPDTSVFAFPFCTNPATNVTPVTPVGVQTTAAALPTLPYPAFLSIVCWNGGDNAYSSLAAIDAVQFWGSAPFKLNILAPTGFPGSIYLENSGGLPGRHYITPITLAQGSFPYGWLFGLDISPGELFGQIQSGAPFSGVLGAFGQSTFFISSGVPAGIAVHAVSLQFESPGPFGGAFINATTPEFFLTQ
jgi:hypothetical protein